MASRGSLNRAQLGRVSSWFLPALDKKSPNMAPAQISQATTMIFLVVPEINRRAQEIYEMA